MLNNLLDPGLSKKILKKIFPLAEKASSRLGRPAVVMEVCGTHTVAISQNGLRASLAGYLDLRSGPGCPVCVTDQLDIDNVIALARLDNTVIATFGDMLRVPGTKSSLERERARGARVKVFYSPEDAVHFAETHPEKEVIFLGVGFETTAPAVALSIAAAENKGLENYSVLSLHKLVPPVMKALLSDRDLTVDGFILPGHVCTITGRRAFDFLAEDFGIPAVIAGFEPVDILKSVYLLLELISGNKPETLNGYTRLVQEDGNQRAQRILGEFFETADASWRGFGRIPASGLSVSKRYSRYDAAARFPVDIPESHPPEGCACGEVLKGKTKSPDCPLFAGACTPLRPVGPCMVSSEGTCAAYYNYEFTTTDAQGVKP